MKSRARFLFLVVAALGLSFHSLPAQTTRPLVVAPVDDRIVTAIPSSLQAPRAGANDGGAMGETTPLERMQLVLRRTPEQEAKLRQLIEAQQDSTSNQYHQWMTPQAFGAAFGPADSDLAAVTDWLATRGFSSIHVNAGRTLIEFSGTAGAVEGAFHTSIKRYTFGGRDYLATASVLKIPAALAPVVGGLASLNGAAESSAEPAARLLTRDAKSGAVVVRVAAAKIPSTDAAGNVAAPDYTTKSSTGQTVYAVTPYDFAAIYNVTPLWNSQIDGTSQTIAVVGQSDIDARDFVNFRTLFGLPIDANNSPTATKHLNIIYNGPNPGPNADEIKGDADTQWSGAIAKGAVIDYVASQTTAASQGSDLSAAYIVDNDLAPVMVDSFSRCERDAGSSYDMFITGLWQQAAAEGITVVVAAGDSGSAACDATNPPAAAGSTANGAATPATQGLAVNAIASTPYNVAVGGTDFYMPNGGEAYWNATNDATQASAKGYIPEAVWNDSCANPAYSAAAPYNGESPQQVCGNASAVAAGLIAVRGGGGGPSTCTQSSGGGCSGGTAKPSWQTGVGVPNDAVRDVPDLSLFSGDGAFGSLYFVCQQSADPSNSSCALGEPAVNFVGAGGTSFASAAFAGVMALVNQRVASKSAATGPALGQGNANYTLYALAREQGKAGAGCNATGSPSSSCIFNDITLGTNAMPCAAGSPNCNGSGVGILSGYNATPNYDLASGLGSINVANLVNGWQSVTYLATATTLTLSPVSIVHGQPVAANVTVSGNGTPTGQVSINADAANGSVGGGTLISGSFSATYTTFPGGSYAVHGFYGGDGTFAASESVPVDLTVTPEPSITTEKLTDQNRQSVSGTIPCGDILTLQTSVAGQSGQGTATGNVHLTDAGNVLYGGAYRLNSSGYTDLRTNSLPPAQHSFVSSYDGDPSFNASQSAPYSLNIVKANTSAAITANSYTAADNTTVTFTVIIGTTGFGYLAPSGVVTLTSNGQPIGSATLQGQPGSGANFDRSVATISVAASLFPTGSYPVSVSYPGDINYLGSSATTSQAVTVTNSGQPITYTALSLNPQIVAPNGSITFSATVTSTPSTGINGKVQFAIDGQNVSAPLTVVNGVASALVSVAGFVSGPHIGTAIYLGDSTHKSSLSNHAAFIITGATGPTASRTNETISPTTAVQGTGVQIAAIVSAAVPGTAMPTGTIQLLVDNNFNGAPQVLSNATGSFTLVTSVLQAGLHTATVYYAGDGVYMPSYSQPMPFTITAPGNTPTTVTISNVPPLVGAGVTFPFTATVHTNSTNTAALTGTLEVIVDKGAPLPQTQLQSNPQGVTLDTTGLALGVHSVAVYYSGDATYTAAVSPATSFTVIPANSTFTLSPATATAHMPLASDTSTPVTFTVTPTVGGSFPVTFACSNLPVGVGCVFTPATVNIVGLTPGSTVLTLVGVNTGRLMEPALHGSRTMAKMLGGGISFAGLLLFLVPVRRRRLSSLIALMVVVALGAVVGCGSGVAPERGPYAVTVTATSAASALGVTTRTATVQLTIGGISTTP